MEINLLVLAVLAFSYVCLLPFIFFKGDGTFNLLWCLTAFPYVVYPCILIAAHLGYIAPMMEIPGDDIPEIIAVCLFALSIGLISMTVGGHRVPLALWHQNNDAPVNIVTYGAYKRVRHPFYTSFIMCFIAGILIFPHIYSVALSCYGLAILTFTAKKEERKLSNSEFGQEYKDYMKVTGRFFPKLF